MSPTHPVCYNRDQGIRNVGSENFKVVLAEMNLGRLLQGVIESA